MFLNSNRIYFSPEGAGTGAGEGGQDGAGAGGQGGAAAPGEGFNFTAWRDQLKDPKIKAAAERYNSAEDMLTSNITLRQEIADRIRLPGPNATPEDTQKFRRGLGVPDDPKGYEVKLPDGVTASDMDQALIDLVRPIAHGANLSAKGFNDLISGFMTKAKEVEAQTEKALKDAAILATASLKKEWGTEFDKNREMVFRAVKAFGGDDMAKAIEEAHIEGFGRLGDWPPFLKVMAAIGKRADEADLHLGGGGGDGAATAKQELDALLAKGGPGTEEYKKNQPRIQELYGILYGKKPIVGGGGRTT